MIKNYRSAIELRNAINGLVPKDTKTETMLKVLGLIDKLEEIIKEHQPIYANDFKELMNQYDVKEENGIYTWSEHDQQKEISEKALELLNAEIKEIETNLFDDLEIIQLGEGLPVADITSLRKILKK